ncbi:MAG: RluA family pseudouridine synthase [Ruminococcaceae bacterium]|nr:RluA family pseudouridine synthase [Oscillospiraceae bacterium]
MNIITTDDVGKRLDVYISESESVTRSAAQKLIASENVTVNGKFPAKNYKLRLGDEVETELPEPVSDDAVPQDIPLDIVFEDADLLVVNKPRGMVVHPAAGNPDGTLVNALLFHCADSLSGIGGVIRPGIVHRIDKDTSGLLIVAKNDNSHLHLAAQIKEHSFEREYRAIVLGNLRDDHGTVDAPIGRDVRDRKRMAVTADGRPARTHYEVLERFSAMGHSYTFVRCILETGRTHQIRVHMKSLGHPLLGDTLYGGGSTKFEISCSSLISGQCLTASHIGFVHPTTGEFLRFSCPLPDYFNKILTKLRKASQ